MFRKSWSPFKSFGYAFYGMWIAFRDERNMRIHLVLAAAAVFLGAVLKVNAMEFLLIMLNIALVLVAELVNSSLEESFDIHTKKLHPQIKIGKDIAAGAVLIAALNALLTGSVIFVPKLLLLLK